MSKLRSLPPSLSIGNQGQIRCGSLELILISSASSGPRNPQEPGRRGVFLARRLKSFNVINHVSAVQVNTALFKRRKEREREEKNVAPLLSFFPTGTNVFYFVERTPRRTGCADVAQAASSGGR